MRAYDIIEKKKRGIPLSREEIKWLVDGFLDGTVPDYQMSAFLMAVYFRSMTEEETVALTEIMRDSGDKVDLSAFGKRSADKHSTGGVGDKTSLIAVPIAAALGAVTAKMSGRGLGHTGGTVDKLESIPGYRSSLSAEEFLSQAERTGIVITGQSGDLTPADKKLYALRDVTATVDSIPLIASSIMSKKLASGAANIVLDVKYGSGAFMKDKEGAEALASLMVKMGQSCGRATSAVISNMNEPLGYAVGNAIEIKEAYEILSGKCGKVSEPLKELSLVLAARMAALVKGIESEEAYSLAREALEDGRALLKFKEWISAQGGDTDFLDRAEEYLVEASYTELLSPADGYICAIDAETAGKAAAVLGAGRAKKDDVIDMRAGLEFFKKRGDRLKKGEPLARLFSSEPSKLSAAADMLLSAVSFSDTRPADEDIVYKVI